VAGADDDPAEETRQALLVVDVINDFTHDGADGSSTPSFDALQAWKLPSAASPVPPRRARASGDPIPTLTVLDFVWQLGELAAAGGDPRELLFGPNPLTAT
jgi:hypothetical protein